MRIKVENSRISFCNQQILQLAITGMRLAMSAAAPRVLHLGGARRRRRYRASIAKKKEQRCIQA
jgi:hypothetical protein